MQGLSVSKQNYKRKITLLCFKDGERVDCTHTTSGFLGGGAGLPNEEKIKIID